MTNLTLKSCQKVSKLMLESLEFADNAGYHPCQGSNQGMHHMQYAKPLPSYLVTRYHGWKATAYQENQG